MTLNIIFFFLGSYSKYLWYILFIVTLGKVSRDCSLSDPILKANNQVLKNGCNTLSTSSKECYCDTNFCNTNMAQQDIEFIETAEIFPNSQGFRCLNDNLNLLSLMSTANIFLMKI